MRNGFGGSERTNWWEDQNALAKKLMLDLFCYFKYEHREEHDLKNLDEELSTMPDWDEICWECAIRKKRTLHEKGSAFQNIYRTCSTSSLLTLNTPPLFLFRTWMLPLHCWRYSGDGWSYEAPLPDWAKAMNIGHERVVEGQKETADLENQLKVKA